jgi:hypothetical protein
MHGTNVKIKKIERMFTEGGGHCFGRYESKLCSKLRVALTAVVIVSDCRANAASVCDSTFLKFYMNLYWF